MFLTAIGRLGSVLEMPPESLDLSIFLDAGGRARETRVWGGLACLGDRELQLLEQRLVDLKKAYPKRVEESRELKGKRVPTSIAKELGQQLREEERRSLFWASSCCDMNDRDFTWLRALFSAFLASQEAVPHRLDREQVGRQAVQKNGVMLCTSERRASAQADLHLPAREMVRRRNQEDWTWQATPLRPRSR
jgi:hypothetical protein